VNDVLRPEDQLVRREGDVLVVARCDLWRRKPGPPGLASRRLPFHRLQLLGPLIQAGLRYELLSGDALPEPDGFAAVLLLEETPQCCDAAFYRRLEGYVRRGGRVVVMGEPVYPGGRPDLFRRFVTLPGVVRVGDVYEMVRALSRVLGRDKLPPGASRPTARALALARELKETRRSRVFLPLSGRGGRSAVLFDAVRELGRCGRGWVLWDGTRRWLRGGEAARTFRNVEQGVEVEVRPTATSLLRTPPLKLPAGEWALDLAVRNPAGGGFLVDVVWRGRGRSRPVAHVYLGSGKRFSARVALESLGGAGRFELTFKHALVDGLEGAKGVLLERLRVLRPG